MTGEVSNAEVQANLIAAGLAAVTLIRSRWWLVNTNFTIHKGSFNTYQVMHIIAMVMLAYFFFPAVNFTFEEGIETWLNWFTMIFLSFTVLFSVLSNDFWHLAVPDVSGKMVIRINMMFTVLSIASALIFMISALVSLQYGGFTKVWVLWSFILLCAGLGILAIGEFIFCWRGTQTSRR